MLPPWGFVYILLALRAETVVGSHCDCCVLVGGAEHCRHVHKRSSLKSLFGSSNTFDPMGSFFLRLSARLFLLCTRGSFHFFSAIELLSGSKLCPALCAVLVTYADI